MMHISQKASKILLLYEQRRVMVNYSVELITVRNGNCLIITARVWHTYKKERVFMYIKEHYNYTCKSSCLYKFIKV